MNSKEHVEKMYDIAAFGEILIDFTYQGVNDKGQKLFAQNPGGAPANVLVAAQRLGAHTAFMGKAGEDMHGRFLKHILEQEKIDTRGFILDDGYFTTLAFVELNEAGERNFSFARKPGADTQMKKEEVNMDVAGNSRIFHIGSLSLTDEPSKSTTFYMVEKAKEKGALISYDPNYRASLWKDEETAKREMRSMVPYVDIMKISDEETELLTGRKSPEEAAKALCSQGVGLAVVTLGKEGAYVCSREGGRIAGGFSSKVVDTNGAGDSFWGGFLYQVSRCGKGPDDISLEEAAEFARFGNAVASLCVEGSGAIPAMPSMERVMERLKEV
ncbi:carbohydrate kinase [Lachnospiraceae bacterium 62-35]